jgi:hypothetical protein
MKSRSCVFHFPGGIKNSAVSQDGGSKNANFGSYELLD